MKLIVEIQDDKASLVMQMLNDLPFVKTQELQEEILTGIEQGVKEMILVKKGATIATDAKEFLNSLHD